MGKKDFVLVHALHAVQCAGQGPIWRWSFLQQVCVVLVESNSACLGFLSGECNLRSA